ncbi:MAG: hypothetical protein JWQ97_3115 [Phenylobacterium sp.]|nr:hypothetical protein [Phenylobacterium sp.]
MVAAAVGALAATPALPALAQQTGGSQAVALEEVVVTARKREESLQSVPVSVTARTDADLRRQNINTPTELSRTVPSLRIVNGSSSDNSAQIVLRGQTASDNLIGVSQPVGLYEDNVNIPHPFGANNAFFDLQRVEVLKGPQGTLYGRNTTGGAINIITKDADFNGVHGFVEGEYGNYKDSRVGGALNVPFFNDVLAARFAYMHWQREGFGRSSVTGQRFGADKHDDLFRVSVVFQPISSLRAKLKYEYGQAAHTGPMQENVAISAVPALANAAYLSTALWSNPAVYRSIVRDAVTAGSPTQAASLANAVAVGKALLDPCIGSPSVNCVGSHVFDDVKTWHLVFDVTWDVTDHARLRSITGGHHFTNRKDGDLDDVQAQLLEIGYGIGGLALAPSGGNFPFPVGRGFELKDDQESTQWSQEFNFSGDFRRLNWLVGAYGSEDLGHGAQTNAFQPDLAAASGRDPGLGSHDGIKADNRTWAVFTQNDYHLTDQLSVTLGARYTEERLASDLADWNYSFTTGLFTCNGLRQTATGGFVATTFLAPNQNNPDSCAYGGILTEGPDRVFSRRKFTGSSYLASANYQITPDKLIYFKFAKGFRGGAYGRAHDLMAAPEVAKDIEVGFKGDWFDRRLRTNIALFQTKYSNKQVSIQTCTATGVPPAGGSCPLGTGFSTIVRNAAKAKLKGVEAEIIFRPIEHLTLNASASAIDAKFTDWPGAVSTEGAPLGNAAGLDISLGSYGTPNWQGDFNARYDLDVGPGNLAVTLDYAIRGRIPVTPVTNQAQFPDALEWKIMGSAGVLNGRLQYTIPDQGLELGLFATNITNKVWGYTGISANFTAGISHMVVMEPRMFGVTVRKTFGGE